MRHEELSTWDEEAGQWQTHASGPNHSGKHALYIVGYFLLLAIIVVPAQSHHLGMQGIFFAMAGAGFALALLILLFKWTARKVSTTRLSRRGFFQLMVGYQPETVETEPPRAQAAESLAQPMSRSLVPATILPYPDESELPESIIEENPLYLSDIFQPNVNSLLGATVLLCGIRRSGKSNMLAVLAEELARYYTPMLICDTEDEYGPLAQKEYLPRGIMAGSIDLYHEAKAAGLLYVPIDRDGAYEFGQSIPRDVLQVILNLQSFEEDEAALIMSEIIDGMNDWEQSQPNSRRVPCVVMLDEATKWIPQQTTESCITDKEALALLQKAIFGTMVRRGGKRGLGMVLSAQRIAELDKRALQSVWKFFFRQTEETDLARYKTNGLERDDVLALRQGECFIFSPGVIGFKTMIRQRRSPHLAHTPGLAQLASHLRQVTPLDLISSRSYAAVTGHIDTEPMSAQQAQSERPKTKTLEERAVDAWNEGYQSGRKLAAALDISEGAGNQLMNRLLVQGRISKEKPQQEAAEESDE